MCASRWTSRSPLRQAFCHRRLCEGSSKSVACIWHLTPRNWKSRWRSVIQGSDANAKPGADLETADKRQNPCCASATTSISHDDVWSSFGLGGLLSARLGRKVAARDGASEHPCNRVASTRSCGPSSKVDIHRTPCRKESLRKQQPATACGRTPMQLAAPTTSCHGTWSTSLAFTSVSLTAI